MPMPTTAVVAGMAVTAVAAGVSVGAYVKDYAVRRERDAAMQEAQELMETVRRNQEEAERREARRKEGDAAAGPQVPQPYGRAVELMQLHVASALDQLSASLRAAGVGSLSPVPLPGAEDPDLVAAYAALLLGRDAWGVMGPARMQALLTFGGTLAALSPTASRVVEEWLRRLGGAEGGILPDLRTVDPDLWLVGPAADARNLSAGGMGALQGLLLGVQELLEGHGVDKEGGGAQPVAWVALMQLHRDDIPALELLLRSHLPTIVLHPNTDCVNNAKGTAMTVSAVKIPDGRCCLRLLTPSYKLVLVVCGLPKSVKKFTFGWGDSYFNRPVKQSVHYNSDTVVPSHDVQRDIARLFAHVYLHRAVRVVQRRLQQLRRRMADGAGPEPLSGCGAEHCAALSGSMRTLEEVLDHHAMWGQVAEQLQQDGRQQRVVAGLKARLMQHLQPPPPHPTQPTSQAADAGCKAARLVQLEREVDDFLSCLMPLTAARYMGVPRAGPAALLPQDVLADEAVDAEAWRGVMGFVTEKAGARLALRYAHEERDRARREAVVTPWWLPPALYVSAVAAVAVVVLGLMHAAGGWLGHVSPQVVADVCEGAGRAVGWALAMTGAKRLLGAAVWRLLRAWRLWLSVLQAWLAVRWTVKLLPRDVAAGVVWVRDYLGLGLFLGRYRLPDLQRRVDVTLSRWAVRLAEARMREAVARGSVSWAGVQAIMGAMEAAAGTGAGPKAGPGTTAAEAEGATRPDTAGGSGSKGTGTGMAGGGKSWIGQDGYVEVVLPGSQEEVEAFLRLPVVEEEGQGQGEGAAGKPREGEAPASGLEMLGLLQRSMGYELGWGAVDSSLALPGPEQLPAQRQKRSKAHRPSRDGAGNAAAAGAGSGAPGRNGKAGGRGEAARAANGATEEGARKAAGVQKAPAGDRTDRRAGGRGHKAVSQRLAEDGWQVVRRGRHVVYRREVGGGRTQTFVRSATPSDWRTARNQLAELRRRNWEAAMGMRMAAMELAPKPPELMQALLGFMGKGEASDDGEEEEDEEGSE